MLARAASRALVLAMALLALAAVPALAVPAVSGEFPVPEIDTNDKIIEGPDGNMWVALTEAGKDVAKITPAGVVTPYNVEAITSSGIAVGPEGRIWLTRNGGLVTFDPANPEGTDVPTTLAEIGTTHSIARGPDGNMWVATDGKVIRIQAADPSKFTVFPIAGLEPRDIDAAGQLLAVADTNSKRIVTLTTAGISVEYKIPGASQGVAGAPTGQIGFSQQGTAPEQVGLISPPTLLPLVETPGGVGDPFGATFGSDQAFWFAMSANDGVARLTSSGQLTQLNGFAKGSFPRQIAPGPNNTLWVTLDMTEKVGLISGLEPPLSTPPPPPPPPTEPKTKLDKGPKGAVVTKKKRAKVSFRFSSPDAGASFECRVKRLPKKLPPRKASASAGKKKLPKPVAFKACKSPRQLSLKPGRYRFEVRAVLAGVVDATPAKRSFRVVRAAV